MFCLHHFIQCSQTICWVRKKTNRFDDVNVLFIRQRCNRKMLLIISYVSFICVFVIFKHFALFLSLHRQNDVVNTLADCQGFRSTNANHYALCRVFVLLALFICFLHCSSSLMIFSGNCCSLPSHSKTTNTKGKLSTNIVILWYSLKRELGVFCCG